MASTSTSDAAYVWAWLPGSTEPVPVGVLARTHPEADIEFHYGRAYLDRSDAVSLYSPVLPLEDAWFPATGDLGMPGPIRDASPDAWGRRVILNRLTNDHGPEADTASLTEMTYLMHSGSNRLGALDFQASEARYVPRDHPATLEQLIGAAEIVQSGDPLPPDLADAAVDGTTIGGARPKALINDGDEQWLAKFVTSSDEWSVVGAEAASIYLADKAGIEVPDFEVVRTSGREVLLTRRFDRAPGGRRHMVVSALTMSGLGENEARRGTYTGILDVLRAHGREPGKAGADLFRRVAFNMAISNTDDHLRNHAALWDGSALLLSPAYDLSPGSRSGETAYQAIAYGRDGRRESTFPALLEVSSDYGLSRGEGRSVIEEVRDAVDTHWGDAADAGKLTITDRRFLWGRQFLNVGTTRGI